MFVSCRSRPGLQLLLCAYRSVLANTLLLTAFSTIIAAALWVGKQPDIWAHPHLLNALTAFASVTTGMRAGRSYMTCGKGHLCLQNMTAQWTSVCRQAIAMGEVTLLDIDRAGADPDVDADSWIGHVVFSRWLACTASKLHAMALQQLRGKADLTILTLCPMTGLFEAQTQRAAVLPKVPVEGYTSTIVSCLRGLIRHDTSRRPTQLVVLGCMSGAEASDLSHPYGVHMLVELAKLLLERSRERGWPHADRGTTVLDALLGGRSSFEELSALANYPNLTCHQSAWVRLGFTLLLLIGLVLPTTLAAFRHFNWTSLVVQLLFVQSFWSVHEVSRALEDRFLRDLSDTVVVEYQEQLNSQIWSAQPDVVGEALV